MSLRFWGLRFLPDLGGQRFSPDVNVRKITGTPNIHLGIVDVRDVAQAHVDAISNQGSNNDVLFFVLQVSGCMKFLKY